MAKTAKEAHKTRNDVFDAFTERNLFALSARGLFDDPLSLSPIMIGKEANVFSAMRGGVPIIIKIYRLETCDFRRMYEYLVVDPRLYSLKRSRRQIIFAWCRREYSNLMKVRDAGMLSPTPYAFKDNILIMEMIGDPALQLKDARVEDYGAFYEAVIEQMRLLYHEAKLVHGDLSKFNILVQGGRPYLIDFSQSVPLESPNSQELLERDARNIAEFFSRYFEVTQKDVLDAVVNKPHEKL